MSNDIKIECSLCGRTGEPPASCDICHGGAQTQTRGYTLSEIRAGVVPEENRLEGLEPKASPLVVGGAVDHPANRTPEKS